MLKFQKLSLHLIFIHVMGVLPYAVMNGPVTKLFLKNIGASDEYIIGLFSLFPLFWIVKIILSLFWKRTQERSALLLFYSLAMASIIFFTININANPLHLHRLSIGVFCFALFNSMGEIFWNQFVQDFLSKKQWVHFFSSVVANVAMINFFGFVAIILYIGNDPSINDYLYLYWSLVIIYLARVIALSYFPYHREVNANGSLESFNHFKKSQPELNLKIILKDYYQFFFVAILNGGLFSQLVLYFDQIGISIRDNISLILASTIFSTLSANLIKKFSAHLSIKKAMNFVIVLYCFLVLSITNLHRILGYIPFSSIFVLMGLFGVIGSFQKICFDLTLLSKTDGKSGVSIMTSIDWIKSMFHSCAGFIFLFFLKMIKNNEINLNQNKGSDYETIFNLISTFSLIAMAILWARRKLINHKIKDAGSV